MQIRDMRPDDLDRVVAIIAAHEAWDEPYARAYFMDYLARREQNENEQERNFIAEIDDRVIGVCGFAPPKFPTEDVLWGTWFYVDAAHRGTRIGITLVERALEALRPLDIRKVYLDTSSATIYGDAVALYTSLGFTEEGRLKDYYEDGEDLIIMGKRI